MIVPRVKLLISGLPFDSKGYERAKNILKDKYGKPSMIVNTHIQRTMQLPVVYGTNPKEVYDLYKGLEASPQYYCHNGTFKRHQ